MKKFRFYKDIKIEAWVRDEFEVISNSSDKAKSLFLKDPYDYFEDRDLVDSVSETMEGTGEYEVRDQDFRIIKSCSHSKIQKLNSIKQETIKELKNINKWSVQTYQQIKEIKSEDISLDTLKYIQNNCIEVLVVKNSTNVEEKVRVISCFESVLTCLGSDAKVVNYNVESLKYVEDIVKILTHLRCL